MKTEKEIQLLIEENEKLKSSLLASERFRIEDAANNNDEKIMSWEKIKSLQSQLETANNRIEEVSVGFAEWIGKNFYRDCTETRTDWFDLHYKINEERRYYTTQELFNLYIKSK